MPMEKIIIQSDRNNLVEVEQFIDDVCGNYNINNYAATISMSLLQAVKNAIVHGNHSDASKQVTIVFDHCKGGVSFTVADEGNGFDYANYGSIPAEEGKGMGLYLMNALSDKISFQNNGSVVRMEYVIDGIAASSALERIMTLKNYYALKTAVNA